MQAVDECASWRREELEEIGEAAFWECTSLHDIVIPPAVKRIKRGAFYHCTRLTNVHLGDCEELEEIGELAFCVCSSLRDIAIPPAVKEIGELAFCVCTLLREIVIPPSVKVIHKEAFLRCSNLTNVRFCDEIECPGKPNLLPVCLLICCVFFVAGKHDSFKSVDMSTLFEQI